jgi:hypothetical protein
MDDYSNEKLLGFTTYAIDRSIEEPKLILSNNILHRASTIMDLGS